MTTVGPTREIGHGAGLASTSGIPTDPSEWSPELMWPLNVMVYDRMRRQDAQVKSVLNAVTLPIRRTPWRLVPNGAPENVVKQIADELGVPILGDKNPVTRARDRGRFSWKKHVRIACLVLPYGHMPCEIAGEIGDDGLWHLTGLPERLPPTIAKINTDRAGELVSIEQFPSGLAGDAGGNDVIDASRLVMYSHEREGGMWQGNSILRSAYKNWLIKDRLIKVDAIKHERNGLGVPGFKAPPNAGPKIMQQLRDIASAFRVGESSGLAWPDGAEFFLTGVTGSLPDTLASIRYHDEQIAREALAQFLELVTSSHGSRALATSFIDFFLMALQATADEIAETVNEDLIERWVDWNWGEDVPAPKLQIDEIGNQTALTAEAIAALVTAGALVADESIDSYLRDNFRLPERSGALNPSPPANEIQTDDTTGKPPVSTTPPALPVAARRRHPFHASSPANTENAPDWTGKRFLTRLVAHYAPLLRAELADVLDSTAFVEAAIASGHPETYAQHVALDLGPLDELLRQMWGDAYLAGYYAGERELRKAGVRPKQVAWAAGVTSLPSSPLPAAPPTIDWSKWTPGSPDAAALLAASNDGSTGLAALLANASVTIKGIEGTTLDTLGNTIAAGVESGASSASIARDVEVIVTNKVRAEMIAQTEVSRAMNAATLDSYRENQIEARVWLLSDGACPLCEENEADGEVAIDDEFTNGDPPVHPNCVCAIAPVVGGSVGDAEGGE